MLCQENTIHYCSWAICSRWSALPPAANDHAHTIRTLCGHKILRDHGPSPGRMVYSRASIIPGSCAVVFDNRKFAGDRKTLTALDLLLALLSEVMMFIFHSALIGAL